MKKLELLKNMITSGVNNLYNHYPQIDKLNVFPVPDGDTGTNMNLTATNGYNEVIDVEYESIGKFLSAFSRGLIMGARGNSGVIFSQIIKGLSLGMNNAKELSVSEWKSGFSKASEIAYKAVMKPVEGTILTVIRETSEKVNQLADDTDIKDFWKQVVKNSNQSLENTPNLLPLLKEVGVVDSGGYGLVKFLEGIEYYVLNDQIVNKLDKLEVNTGGNIDMQIEEEFGYCTEAIVMLNDDWINKLQNSVIRDQLQIFGNTSIVVVVDNDILKVHTHSLSPGQVLQFLQQYGDFQTLKIENMNLQANKQVKNKDQKWKENSDIKTERKLINETAIISVVSSEKQKRYFEDELGISFAINAGAKMNPSTEDFLQAIETVDAKTVFLLPNSSNVYLTAKQAEKIENKSKIYVIQTKTIQQGMVAALNFDPSLTASKNYSYLSKSFRNVVSFNITKAEKNTTYNGIEIQKDNLLVIVDNNIIGAEQTLEAIFDKQLSKYIKSKTEIITIFVGGETNEQDLVQLRKFLDEGYDVEYEIVDGGQETYNLLIAIE
ncbi:DAK2 domain-containing protein [Mycoplasma mycoides subsp. mycoides]|uniref:PREDICTED KINASE RELATED TO HYDROXYACETONE KINASE n=2 Tax=Mycoplasma mycoides subsp. mycoides TaxID=2103 RepID=Q6MTC7_MYCMS|nr:DAK2 domain-containing protein [Mycoplasma mycoides]CAE77109.1 PREDICTED KINASE RELATED TO HYDROXYACETONE KINASE [Mycoplasma mycoides subsp. mycoides SC str. PG1]ADK70090.1 DAK2 domain fusion protein YloV [Mycoplasma mycoides subsp. mycoides SC str. Gladysdale]AIZ55342.1 phosphatase [Mycoplasma mycoides subsp. mycoides]AME10689.1 kinase [Mycoplasma mycoides subsp. mycoides]KJQ45919.1 DAK2 domain fusion YloV family protein [Mycoplasma mycoides subsp. mycoides]